MRDRRFIAAHRGGPLDEASHINLARWAVDCAETVIDYFEEESDDLRPRKALVAGRAWADGQIKTGIAIRASAASHAAARLAKSSAAISAARAAAQAVATAHFADHSMGALIYSMKALEATGMDSRAEFTRQIARLPEHLRDQVASGVTDRARRLSIPKSNEAAQGGAR